MSQAVHWIGGQWFEGLGEEMVSTNPSSGKMIWEGRAADEGLVGEAIAAARDGFEGAWGDTYPTQRIEYVEKFAQIALRRQEELACLIAKENGKPLWEARTEAGAVVGKINLAISGFETRRSFDSFEIPGAHAVTRYKPYGVVAVLGPFNLPAHLPNGHIVPALLAGNTVVLKPSELTPKVGEFYMKMWEEAGLPKGVLNMVQGGAETGRTLAQHDGIDGVFFTGSSRAGLALHEYMGKYPQKILALEMGGNNPLIVHQAKDLEAAAYQTILSAYITSGQRCTCARRLIVPADGSYVDDFVGVLTEMMGKIRVGDAFLDDGPFMGPVISAVQGERLLAGQKKLVDAGGKLLVEMKQVGECVAMLSPGLIDVTGISKRSDEEMFGPMLQLIRVDSFDEAIVEANDTAYGLSAGLMSDDAGLYKQFIKRIRAGVVNWNRQTTGASGKLAFGGVGHSGNHKPSGFFAADYCSYPVASIEVNENVMPAKTMQGIDL